MLFNSLEFLVFFPLVTAAYFLLRHEYRWLLLLLASCVFYMAFVPYYILILAFTIIVDYVAGIAIEGAVGNRRKIYLAASIVANVSTLAIFKYFNFFTENSNTIFHFLGIAYQFPYLGIVLPIGLSFHTFQAMSYTIEVYRGRQKAEHHFGIYALYVMYYPQLVAGPIERPQNLLPQFHTIQSFDYDRVVGGVLQMAWGLFKKIVIAERLAKAVNNVYSNVSAHNGVELSLASVLFAFQIYCDFSGYSDIALGASEVMGISLMKNFNEPYSARSVPEFWKRWHISLSTWFKDYLYLPLGGNRVAQWRNYLNLMFVFAVSGFWHGAKWTFVIWGVYHGLLVIASHAFSKYFEDAKLGFGAALRSAGLATAVSVVWTFILVDVGWIFFRAKSCSDAFYTIGHLHTGWAALLTGKTAAADFIYGLGMEPREAGFAVLLIACLQVVESLRNRGFVLKLRSQPIVVRWGFYYASVMLILAFGMFNHSQFIYFQF